jgi:RNA-directed DNA polymerase
VRIWTPKATFVGSEVDPALVSHALLAAAPAIARGLPPVLSLGHLAASAGVDYFFCRNVVSRSPRVSAYTTFRIRKRSGGSREIAVPSFELLRLQRWINSSILSKIPVHGAAHAFCPDRGIKTMAAAHCGCRFLVKLDLKNFFGSLNEKSVFWFFHSLGYSPLVSFEMARICTYISSSVSDEGVIVDEAGGRPYPQVRMGVLPQGAPTSPALSNHLVRALDTSIFSLASAYGLSYTRYSDDMAFSSCSAELSRAATTRFIREVGRLIGAQGLTINRSKTSVRRAGSRRIVTGLLVDGQEPRLTRKFKRSLELHLYYSRKFGLATHAKSRGFDSAFGLYRYLQGLSAFARDIENAWGEAAHEVLTSIARRDGVT